MRRLPVYLLIDCSESMAGSAIDSVNDGLQKMISGLRSNPYALETVYLSLITFSDTATQLIPLKELTEFQIPRLNVRPGTSLGAALNLLAACIKKDVVKTTAEEKGDYRPLVFLLTDGQPTDNWERAIHQFTSAKDLKVANIYAIGCGDEVDFSILRKVTDIVFKMSEMSADAFGKLFVWLTASVTSASRGAAEKGADKIPDLPREIVEITPEMLSKDRPSTKQVFIRARCNRTKKAYLMRFKYQKDLGKYLSVASHPLDEEGEGEAVRGGYSKLDSQDIVGCPPCPYCENTSAGICSCGGVFCVSEKDRENIVCPQCSTTLKLDCSGGPVQINQSRG